MESVSVIIPTYYRNNLLTRALESVCSSNYKELEVVVVDDSGKGHAESVVRNDKFNNISIKYIKNTENKGLTLARKTGIECSESKYIHFLDDDDQLLPTAIEKKINLMKEKECSVAYSGLYLNDQSRVVLPNPAVCGNVLKNVLMFNLSPCIPSTMLVDKDQLDKLDFNIIEKYGLHNEYAMQIQLAKSSIYEFVNEPLVIRDLSGESRGASHEAVKEYIRTYNIYSDLYDRFPPHVRRQALAYINFLKGQFYIKSNLWSPRAIVQFGKALYFKPGIDIIYLASFLSSILGSPGYQLSYKIYKHILSPNEQKGRSF